MIGVCSLTGVNGASVPVPQRKPDTASLGLISSAQDSHPDLNVGPYHSRFEGEQTDLYRKVFFLQAAGAMDDADKVIPRIRDNSLMGHILAQRYLHPAYKANFEELKHWLDLYADLPEAARIQRLAQSRVPDGFKGHLTPASYSASRIEELSIPGHRPKSYDPKVKRSKAQNNEASAMIKKIRRQIQIYEPTNAMRTLNESKASVYLDEVEKDRLKALIASGYLYAGNTERALELSTEVLKRSKNLAPMAGWVKGLCLWREGEYGDAAAAFEVTAHSSYASGSLMAAASFWSARGYEKSGHRRRAQALLEKAADNPRTFYGLMALQTLGRKPDLNWSAPRLSKSAEKEILATPAGMRAEKLIAAGEITLAEAEIQSLYVKGDHARKRDLLAYATDRRLPSLALKLSHALAAEEIYDSAMYPAMPWEPVKGYRIDRALMHAIIRQESRFNAAAENKHSGATGLMQLMPATASYMFGEKLFEDKSNRHMLKNPDVSLDLGQKYVEHLLNNPLVGQDLLSLAVAYNAGPGKLQKWKSERQDITDPLLFLETVPYAETRAYAERVLANYWIYRMRFDQNTESMQALAQGNWARYAAQDKDAVKFAAK